jgi:hypothetical protein
MNPFLKAKNAEDTKPLVELLENVKLAQIHESQQETTSSPYSGDLLELSLATAASVVLAQQDGTPVWMLLVGNPSSDKTERALSISLAPEVYCLDSMTENSFISGYIKPDGSKPGDLLAELNGKILLIKDLTTLFSLKDDVIKRVLGDLQSIYDGFFSRFMGTRGKVQYSTRLSLLGCVTPMALSHHHRYMAEMGSRFLFYRLPALSGKERSEGLDIVWNTTGRHEKIGQYRKLASSYLHNLFKTPPSEIEVTDGQKSEINTLALLLARGRGVIRSAKREFENEDGKSVSYYEVEEVQIEEPFRAALQLKTLARSLAYVHGRLGVTDHELELLRRVVLSTMPVDRASVLALFQDPKNLTPSGALTVKRSEEGIGKSYGRAKQILTELTYLDILNKSEYEQQGYEYRPSFEFDDLITKPIKPLNHIDDLGLTKRRSPFDKVYIKDPPSKRHSDTTIEEEETKEDEEEEDDDIPF